MEYWFEVPARPTAPMSPSIELPLSDEAYASLLSRQVEVESGLADAVHRQAVQDILHALMRDILSDDCPRNLRITDLRSALRIVRSEGVAIPKAALLDAGTLRFFVTRYEYDAP